MSTTATAAKPVPYMARPIPHYNNRPRWEVIEDARFTLLVEGMLTDSESAKVERRLKARLRKDGLQLIMRSTGEVR